MDLLLLVAGAALIAVAAVDALTTTLVVAAGAGPLSGPLTRLAWRGLLRVSRDGSRLLVVAGPALLVLTLLTWVALLWLGWTLVLLAGDDSVVDATTSAPAGPWDVAYFAGFTVFTLGVGDYVASTPGWRLATATASFSGLFLITLAITYLGQVVGAVVARRALAVRIDSLGRSPADIVARGWTGSDLASSLVQHLVSITGQVATSAEQHLAYPVLHFMRATDERTAPGLALARLDDAMLLVQHALPPGQRPPASLTEPVREAVRRFLDAVDTAALATLPAEPPPGPDVAALRASGVPEVGVEQLERALDEERDHRRRLLQLVRGEGWSWPGV